MLGPALHRGPDLGAEPAVAEQRGITRDQLAVDPGRARRLHLRVEIEIGAHCQRDALAAAGILKPAQLDDRSWRPIASGIEIGQLDVMGASVGSVNHGIGCSLQFVVETAIEESADDGTCETLAGKHVARRTALNTLLDECAVHALDDVTAFGERP